MSGSFELLDIIILVGICQGVFLSLTLQRITNNNRKANKILSLLIFIATMMLMGRFVYFRFFNEVVFLWSLLFDAFVFLFGPLLFLYVQRLLFQNDSNTSLAKIHLIPFFAMIIFFGCMAVSHSPKQYFELYLDGKLSIVFHIVILLGLLLNIFYLTRGFQLLIRFKKEEKAALSFDQNPVNYVFCFLFAVAICLAAWFFSFVNSFFFDRYFTYINYDFIWVAIPIFIYVIGYFSLKQPDLFRINMDLHQKERKNRLTDTDAALLSKKLDSLMLNEKIFLQHDLTLRHVAEQLDTSTNNISWLLNNVYKSTFYDFVNGFRIKEFVEKLEKKEHLQHTILALSIEVGFNSKSTFNKAFKLAMNETPSNFIKSIQAA